MESEYMLIYDAAMDNFENRLETAIYDNGDFAAIHVTNFGAIYLPNYSSIFIPFEKVYEEIRDKKYGKIFIYLT
jgi:hypothetical protein